MPELPEVETIVRALRDGGRNAPSLMGAQVEGAEIFWSKTLETPSVKEFSRRIKGQRVVDIDRRAKYIRLHLSEDKMLVHLRMSGDLIVGQGKESLAKHVRAAVYFKNGAQLAFNNPRKFGRIWLLEDDSQVLGGLGPEPLDPELSPKLFYEMLHRRKRQIKPLLMDQTFLAGVGNIYADEALHLAKIHPQTRGNSLFEHQAAALLISLREVLEEGIRRNGASIDWVYQGGDFQNYFRVYQQTDEPCVECQTPISRIVVAQRGTHFCRSCQPAPVDL